MSELTLGAIEKLLDRKLEGLASKDDLTSELAPMKRQLTSIEDKIDRLGTRSHQDDVATMKDVEKLTQRVTALEETIARLKLAYDA